MAKPKKSKDREHEVRVMLNTEEQEAFKAQAEKLGVGLSTWMRLRLRQVVGLASPGQTGQTVF